MGKHSRLVRRLLAMGIASLILVTFGVQFTYGQDAAPPEGEVAEVDALAAFDAETAVGGLQAQVDSTWLLATGFLVFFMQAGFALLESGMLRQKSVVNSLMENFMDACLGGLVFWAVGYGIAFGASSGGLFGTTNFFLNEAVAFTANGAVYSEGAINTSGFVFFFFQYAFAATAGTIATGAMAERTNFIGKLIYTAVVAAIIYPVVVHWIWGGGWLAGQGFHDFAGSTVVHFAGGLIGLIGAMMLGARDGRVWGKTPRGHNLALATLGTMILWFGWYGFNPGSALSMANPQFVGLVTVNTTLAACAAACVMVMLAYFRTGKWDLPMALNGSLAGLVAITAGCGFVAPWAAVLIGVIAAPVLMFALDLLERLKIDDAVGAFGVHGACGVMGTLAVGFLAQPQLSLTGAGGLLISGETSLLIAQVIGVAGVAVWVSITTTVMFFAIKTLGVLRIPDKAIQMGGIDVYEHGASVWPDVLPHPDDVPVAATPAGKTAPAVGD